MAGMITRLDGTPLDETDSAMVAAWLGKRAVQRGPRVGDHVEFADGKTLVIATRWGSGIQVTTGGTFYLRDNGRLVCESPSFQSVNDQGLTRSARTVYTKVWFYHRGEPVAGGGIEINVPSRCYRSPTRSPK